VLDCLALKPPNGISILRRLSLAGSQKKVFLATWTLTQREVVVKQLIATDEVRDRIVAREAQAHPLSLRHPNIIETNVLHHEGEPFLVEEYLQSVLADDRYAHGVEDASSLLFDIASALSYLHDTLGWVHGDIKPDNIGIRNGRYTLLDFGICRPIAQFTADATATGSLRTRAPELLTAGTYSGDARAVDMWALAATVFNFWLHRYPLFDASEAPPRISHPEQRSAFEHLLMDRALNEWDRRVVQPLSGMPVELRDIVRSILDFDPSHRASAKALLDAAKTRLAPFLAHGREGERLSPRDEADQILQHFPSDEVLRVLPFAVQEALRTRLSRLGECFHEGDPLAQRLAELRRKTSNIAS
jgi:serine/threonine protein kinase